MQLHKFLFLLAKCEYVFSQNIFKTGIVVSTFGNDLASTVDESARCRTEICKHYMYHSIHIRLNFHPVWGYIKPRNYCATMDVGVRYRAVWYLPDFLLCNANNSTGRPCSSIASTLAQLMSALAEIINISVNHDSPAQDGVLPSQGDEGVRDVDLGGAALRCHIAKVSGVARSLGVLGSTMFTSIKVEVRSSGGAAVGVVSKLGRYFIRALTSYPASPPNPSPPLEIKWRRLEYAFRLKWVLPGPCKTY